MKFSPNKIVLLALLVVFLGIESYAQCYKRGGNRGGTSDFSLELGAGMPILLSPSNDSKFGDNKKVEFGLRYLPEGGSFGVRGYYSFAGLSDSGAAPSDHGNKLKIHRLELQGIYMLDYLLGIPQNSIFELESYVGLGAALGKPTGSSSSNKMIATTIGLRPRFLIDSNRLHLYIDTSYGMLFNQRYDYSGEYIPGAGRTNMGSMLHLSVGLSYRL